MKNNRFQLLFSFLFSLFLLPISIFSQSRDLVAKDDQCSNVNSFLDSSERDELNSRVRSITKDGDFLLDPNLPNGILDFESLTPYLNLDDNYSFVEARRTQSRVNSDLEYVRYQEYYKGIKVCGGTVFRPDGPVNPSNPCDDIPISPVFMQTTIFSNINVEVNPSIDKSELKDIVHGSIENVQLEICHQLEVDCEYNLVWTMDYFSDGKHKVWVDAHNGQILKTIGYGIDNAKGATGINFKMRNSSLNITASGEEDIVISTVNDCDDYINFSSTETVLNSLSPICPITEANNPVAFQMVNLIQNMMNDFAGLGMEFNTDEAATSINFIIGCERDGAFNLNNSDFNSTTFILFNLDFFDENGLPLCDVLAHELGHSYLNEFFNKVTDSNEVNSLHEGIADIFGMYFGSFCDNQPIDNLIGEGGSYINDDTGATYVRDLSSAPGDCWGDIESSGGHTQGSFLGNWFWELSRAYDNELLMMIVLDAVESMNNDNNQVSDFYTGVINVVNQTIPEGICSPLGRAIVNQFKDMCIHNPADVCPSFIINGPSTFCEEDNYVCLRLDNLDGEYNDGEYYWQFPYGWDIVLPDGSPYYGNQNNYKGYNICLDFPDYPYYPQYFSICATQRTPEFGERRVCHTLTLKDCDFDDPTCEEYHGLKGFNQNSLIYDDSVKEKRDPNKILQEVSFIQIYDVSGILLYSGSQLSFQERNRMLPKYNTILFISDYNSLGELIGTRKEVLIK